MPRMHLSLELHEEVPAGLPLELFEAAAEAALALGLPASFSEQSFSLTAVAVSQEEIQRLNREYRDKDSVTDILSFWNFASVAELLLEKIATIERRRLPRHTRSENYAHSESHRRYPGTRAGHFSKKISYTILLSDYLPSFGNGATSSVIRSWIRNISGS